MGVKQKVRYCVVKG